MPPPLGGSLLNRILGYRTFPKTQLQLPSIGSERKTYFPLRRRFFDPGVCSRSGWAVSSKDFVFAVRLEQQPNFCESLG